MHKYLMQQVSVEDFANIKSDQKVIGIPRYFCVMNEGMILVYPEPTPTMEFQITVRDNDN